MIFRLFLLAFLLEDVVKSQFNLYDTQQTANSSPLQFDCLISYSRQKNFSYSNFVFVVSRIQQYCLRPINVTNLPANKNLNNDHQNFTFNGLRLLNITAEQLLLWSASIDLAEQYQNYLDHPNVSFASNETFFNCTKPWFGSRCQYSFVTEEIVTPDGILSATSDARQNYLNPQKVTNLTCYIHLKCDRGGPPMCLDWREVCNGRIDCLDGGLDEVHCFELEINECGENEFRCSDGLCVGEEYWNTGDQSIVCDRLCPPEKPFSCGDEQCEKDFDACSNGRHHLLTQSMSAQGNLSYECWVAMTCLTKISDEINRTLCEDFLASTDLMTYIQSCDSLTQFPAIPVLFGHVHFLYNAKLDRDWDDRMALTPDYVCYDELLCEFLIPTFRNGSNTCRFGNEMGFRWDVKYNNWASIIHSIEPYFRGCLTRHEDKSYLQHPSVYCCQNSSKCISKHRIVDGISDCHMNDDEEQFHVSCLMNDTHRSNCHNKDKSRSPFFSRETFSPATQYRLEDILFREICDRFVQLSPEMIDGENHTDETECEDWPCDNIYQRCNSFRDCPDGRDEENCTASTCNPSSLLCVAPDDYALTCLSADRVNDQSVDCLGAMDEPKFCRNSDLFSQYYDRFRCRNTTKCVTIFSLCNGNRDCQFGDDEDFCDAPRDICGGTHLVYRKSVEHALCRFGQIEKMYFSLKSMVTYSASKYKGIDHTEKQSAERSIIANDVESNRVDPAWAWRCNYGIYTRFSLTDNDRNYKCFCPPNHYGDLCQYQNQRVGIRVGLSLSDRNGVYAVIIMLIDDDERQEVHSYQQFIAVAKQYCGESFYMDLLYATRPKNDSKKYSVRIDAFDKASLAYVASWHFSIPFLFLPVNRLAVVLNMPFDRALSPSDCTLKCNNGECLRYTNEKKFFCYCRPGWSGAQCQIPVNCKDCSSESICVGQRNNRSICVCPLGKFGPRCLLTHSCPPNFCDNNGRCIVINPSFTSSIYACICPEQFSGLTCEYEKARLDIHFNNMLLPSYLFIHIITVNEYQPPVQKVMFRKLLILQHTITLHILDEFHIVFVKISSSYYMVVLQQSKQSHLSTSINSAQRCRPVNELLNSTIRTWRRIRQVKYYHMPCQTHSDLLCFFDESYMCLCTLERHANCFKFDHTPDLTCRDKTYCLNGAQCFQDHQLCPLDTLCICTDCYFGDRCQFYAKGIGLTLDDILRYEIRSNTSLANQPFSVKASAVLTMIMFAVGLVNSILSFMTFQSLDSRKVGCGMYLLASSITSLLTITVFTIKFWFLILTQMNASVSRSVLHGGCVSIEYLLKLMLYFDNWLNAAVAVERAVTVFKGASFNKSKSKRAARWIIIFLPIFIMSTITHEPIYRHLFDDKEENRIWCVTDYSPSIQNYNTAIISFHFIAPFSCNLFSALFIIIRAARRRAKTRTGLSYKQHLREQLHEHKQLIISPMILVVLSLPRLIISLLSNCVKSSRNPWLYLSGYLISFIPSIIIFLAFVLPSNLYKKQFKESLNTWRRRLNRR